MEKKTENAPDPATLCLGSAPGHDRLKNIVKKLDTEYVDLLPYFRNGMQNGDTDLFRPSDRHWNPNGHGLAAKIVGEFLLEKNLLPISDINH